MTDSPRTKAGLDLYHANRDGMVILSDAMRTRIMDIEAEAAAPDAGLRERIRYAVAESNIPDTSEYDPATVNDDVTDAVMAALAAHRSSDPSSGSAHGASCGCYCHEEADEV